MVTCRFRKWHPIWKFGRFWDFLLFLFKKWYYRIFLKNSTSNFQSFFFGRKKNHTSYIKKSFDSALEAFGSIFVIQCKWWIFPICIEQIGLCANQNDPPNRSFVHSYIHPSTRMPITTWPSIWIGLPAIYRVACFVQLFVCVWAFLGKNHKNILRFLKLSHRHNSRKSNGWKPSSCDKTKK